MLIMVILDIRLLWMMELKYFHVKEYRHIVIYSVQSVEE